MVGVADGNGVIEGVAVAGMLVLVGVEAFVGTGESVMINVEVGVAVGKLGMMVTPGVSVGTFGTQSNCPA